ncbi:MAG: two-component system response regulator [Chlorobiaceae bacterium]|nr:two-component system response regulator [Chlorobiaceae bacterium]
MLPNSKILIVDDNREFREALARILSATGYDVDMAGDGEEALALIKTKKMHLAIVDIDMPRMDGIQFTIKVKELIPSFPVIIVTGYTQFYKAEEILATGAEAFLKKPVELPMLLDLIKKLKTSG